jgi:hypothetical protein
MSLTKKTHNLFSLPISTEAQSYWLGFFCADGGFHSNLKQFSFQLASKDRSHLEKLAELLSVKIKDGKTYDSRTKKTYTWNRLVFCGKYTIETMMSMGLPLNKTRDLGAKVFDYLTDDVVHHFVRGYFDGDGCISHIGVAEYRVTIVGTEPFLKKMWEIINNDTESRFVAPRKQGKNLYQITASGTDRINSLKRWMYADATIFMERKKTRFDTVPSYRGKSKYKGVYEVHHWVARVYEKGKMRTIGNFSTEELAANALQKYKEGKQ